jgi:hypothetical protein
VSRRLNTIDYAHTILPFRVSRRSYQFQLSQVNVRSSAEAVDLGPSWEIVDAQNDLLCAQPPVSAEPVNAGQIGGYTRACFMQTHYGS